ncbi:hypothetical protein GQ53DRAFT_806764 [Thozetella sp. PMI_491]|nr:hypothetical protein GQ53DRAFT_806764 [Thozetella sp. PMI_491]
MEEDSQSADIDTRSTFQRRRTRQVYSFEAEDDGDSYEGRAGYALAPTGPGRIHPYYHIADEAPPEYCETNPNVDGEDFRINALSLERLMEAVTSKAQAIPPGYSPDIRRGSGHRAGTARPCDWFHIIGGSGTGGLIAIMLGRLQMSVTEVIAAYEKICAAVYPDPEGRGGTTSQGPLLDADLLERELRSCFNAFADELLFQPEWRETGNTVVWADSAQRPESQRSHESLRSYPRPASAPNVQTRGVTVVQAAMATLAHPALFKPALAQGKRFCGPGRCCTPLACLNEEVGYIYGGEARWGIFVSISAGSVSNVREPWREAVGSRYSRLDRCLDSIVREEQSAISDLRSRYAIVGRCDFPGLYFHQRLDAPWEGHLRQNKPLDEFLEDYSGGLIRAQSKTAAELMWRHSCLQALRHSFAQLLAERRPGQLPTTEDEARRLEELRRTGRV